MNLWKQELLNLLLDQQAPEALFKQIQVISCRMGFEHCAYGMRAPLSPARQNIIMFNNYPTAWKTRYQNNGYLAIDPTVKHGMVSLDPYIWPPLNIPKEDLEFWSEADTYGLRNGISIPVLATNGTRGMFTVTRAKDDLDQIAAMQLNWLSSVAHQCMSKAIIHQSFTSKMPHLTRREIEVLKWIAEGRTSSETAGAIGTTERTVNFHISGAMTKLDAPNRIAAVVYAISLGLIL